MCRYLHFRPWKLKADYSSYQKLQCLRTALCGDERNVNEALYCMRCLIEDVEWVPSYSLETSRYCASLLGCVKVPYLCIL